MTISEFNGKEGKRFSEHLFWDVDPRAVDTEKNEPFIVQRVLEFGRLADWYLLLELYGLERITSTAKTLRSLDPRAFSFIATVSSTPKEQFRCYITKQSSQRHWIY